MRLEKLYKRPISETQPSEEAKDGKRRLVFRVLEWGWKGCGGYGGKRMIMIKHQGERYLTKEKNELIDESFILQIDNED